MLNVLTSFKHGIGMDPQLTIDIINRLVELMSDAPAVQKIHTYATIKTLVESLREYAEEYVEDPVYFDEMLENFLQTAAAIAKVEGDSILSDNEQKVWALNALEEMRSDLYFDR